MSAFLLPVVTSEIIPEKRFCFNFRRMKRFRNESAKTLKKPATQTKMGNSTEASEEQGYSEILL